MEFQVEQVSGFLRRVVIRVTSIEVDAAMTRATSKLLKKAQLPGFRPGHVPRSLFERQFAPQIENEALNQILDQNLPVALSSAKLEPLGQPRVVQMTHLHRGEPFSYTTEVEVRPEIVLGTYLGLPVPPPAPAVEAAAVDPELEALRREHAELQAVTDRTAVAEGDVVKMDYLGRVDGVAFPGGTAQDALIEIAEGQVLEDFWRGLIGIQVPGTCTVDVRFPADYQSTDLAGKTAQFEMTLHSLHSKPLPPLDDVLAVRAGETDLASLRASILARLQQKQTQTDRRSRRDALLKALVAGHPLDLPPSMVARQAQNLTERAADQIRRMMGKNAPLDPKMMASLHQVSQRDALFQVHSGLLLEALVAAVPQTVSDADVEARIGLLAAEANMEPAEARAYFEEDPDRLPALREALAEDKLIDHLLEHSSPTAAPTPDLTAATA